MTSPGTIADDGTAGRESQEVAPAGREGATAARGFVLLDAAKLAEPLPPMRFLVKPLGIAAGAPTCVAGYGFSGKSMAMQSLALSLAADRPVWGAFQGTAARALHLDYEQGLRTTQERYQRLAKGDGIDLAAVGDRLQVSIIPRVYLSDRDGVDAYTKVAEGFGLVILDSLRAGAPSVDENSSDVRRYLDPLGRVSEQTGATVIFIHHARKPKADDPEGAKYKLRGSSALFDACSSVYIFEGRTGASTRVTHAKCRNVGVLVDDFELRIEDVEIGGDPRAGVRVTHAVTASPATRDSDRVECDANRIRDFLRPRGSFDGSRSDLRAALRMNAAALSSALARLESLGEVNVTRAGKRTVIQWTGHDEP